MVKNIMRTLAIVATYNFIGFWIAKVAIAFRLSTVVLTEFGVKYTIIYGHVVAAICATFLAFLHGWRDDE
ncbi:hypothetical protein CSV63_06620 [Sporosarcina sp. P34]|uniref:hypothetical protein n=1 Tax=Sporosarcina sp. P34 TaxID=2048247 RepID=UPI000C166591|nr:hypothetical protein [Sporosarcina sp. P34]PID15455.1 hypothetical protein CSV63_06620 [Sporosarcina sp. P34]